LPFILGPGQPQPQPAPSGVTRPTSVGQSIGIGYDAGAPVLQITSPYQCWTVLNQHPARTQTALVATAGPVDLNGIWLVPVSPSDTELEVAATNGLTSGDGTAIEATGSDTRYYVQVPQDSTDPNNALRGGELRNGTIPQAGSPLETVGELNLSDPLVYDASTGSFGQFGPSPAAIQVAGQSIVAGQITIGGLAPTGMAQVAATVPLPQVFTTAPDGGSVATANLGFYLVNAIAVFGSGGAGDSSGGGGSLPPPSPQQVLCQEYSGTPALFRQCNPVRYAQSRDRPTDLLGTASHTADAIGHDLTPQEPYTFQVPDTYLGGLLISGVQLTFAPGQQGPCSDGQWTGSGGLNLGDASLAATFTVCSDGSDLGGKAQLSSSSGIPLIPGVVSLTALDAGIDGDPTKVLGGANVTLAGGEISVPGCFVAVFPNASHPYSYSQSDLSQNPLSPSGSDCAAPKQLQDTAPITSFALGIAGTVELNNIPVLGSLPLSGGYGFYVYPSYFEFGGSFNENFTIFSVSGSVIGALDTGSGAFELSGNLNACLGGALGCVGLSGLVSSKGVGGCGTVSIGPVSESAYFVYPWSGNVSLGLGSCDFGPIQVAVSSGAGTVTGGAATIDVGKRTPVVAVTVQGTDSSPHVQVSGPGGQQAQDPTSDKPVRAPGILIVPLAKAHMTLIELRRPQPGNWAVAALAGSPAIAAVSYRSGQPAPQIKVTAGVLGRRYALHYDIQQRPGQQVVFAERGSQLFHVIGHATGDSGTLAFTPAIGNARQRRIVAIITQDGLPQHELTVGHYTAPTEQQLGPPQHVRVIRHGDELVIEWTHSADAAGYLAGVTLSDGRHVLLHVAGSSGRVVLRHVFAGVTGTVTVAGIGSDGRIGESASGRLSTIGIPAQVRHVRAAAGRSGVVIRWGKVTDAVRYLVVVSVLGSRPATYVAVATGTQLPPSLALRAIRHGVKARISVRAVAAPGQAGAAGVLAYRAA
jgi:hypothetical protein